jgi:hypothetical protein
MTGTRHLGIVVSALWVCGSTLYLAATHSVRSVVDHWDDMLLVIVAGPILVALIWAVSYLVVRGCLWVVAGFTQKQLSAAKYAWLLTAAIIGLSGIRVIASIVNAPG